MRLEFEPNASVLPYVENEVVSQSVSSEVERMLREGVKAAQDGNRTEARNLLLRVTETDTDNENAWLWLASISEYPEELLVFLNNVLRVNPNNERALEWHKATKSLLAKTLVQRGVDAVKDERKEFAKQCFEQALAHEAENEMAWLWMASVADSEEEKTACFEKVLSVNPDNETAQASLESFKKQKTQKLLQAALFAAFDGNHASAQEMIETVLSQNAELEDAWVLKSHLAGSFEERAECFLKLRALNPDNEMAKANLASWRSLADKVAAQPKPEEIQEISVEGEALNEKVQQVAVETEAVSQESVNEEFSAQFSNYPALESFGFSEAEQVTEELSVEGEDANQVLELNEQPTAYFDQPENVQEFAAVEDLSFEDAQPDSVTQDLNLDTVAQNEQETVQTEQSAEPQGEFSQSEEVKNFYEEFQTEEASFESDEPQETVQEFSAPVSDLVVETETEEEEMHLAFNEPQESVLVEDLFSDSDVSDEIHETQSQSVHETQVSEKFEAEDYFQEAVSAPESSEVQAESTENVAEMNVAEMNVEAASEEQKDEEWRNTSPTMFVNYVPTEPENSFEPETAEVFVEETAETAVAEEVTAELSAPVEVLEKPEETFAVNETVEAVEAVEMVAEVEAVEAAEVVEEQVSAPFEEVVQVQPQEEFPYPKAEMILCPFCNAENEKQAFSCASCQTVLTLSDLEMLLNQQNANAEKLQQAVGSLERENESYGLNAEQLTSLGIGHINLKNYRQGFYFLQEAVRMNPNNVVLDAQVNALAIRLAEIEEQQSVHDSMVKNCKILVVDDSPTVRKLISGKLEKCGHEVICAVDGVDALQKINELVPDLILLDITMPRMDGYQVCKLIRSNETTKDVPVVMISGKDGFFDKVRGKMAGTTGYITKPFGPETLMKTVETYLN